MKFTKVPSATFQQIQLNAGILLTDFDPATGELDVADIIGATSGGISFNAAPEYIDFGEDIDNVPANTKELKKLDYFTATMSGTFVTVTAETAKLMIGAADEEDGKITPRTDLLSADFRDVWWVGDYSDKNDETDGGFVAVHLKNSLSTSGMQIQSSDKGKGQFSFEFTGHYSLSDQSTVPFDVYVKGGEYTYTAVTPVGTENPKNEGWYERSGSAGSYVYTLSTDTTVQSGKTYYERS